MDFVTFGREPVINTPSVDWFALSPSLAALVAAAICLLSGAFMPRWILRPFAAFFCALGFIGGGVLALLVYIETPARQRRGRRRDLPRPLRRLHADHHHGRRPAHRVRLVLGPHAPGPHRRVLRASGHGRSGHGLPRPVGQPDDALPRSRVVLGLPLHPLRDRDRPRRLARGRAQVPDHRRNGLGRPALRVGADLRRDRGARLLGDRRRHAHPEPVGRPAPARGAGDAARRARVQVVGRAVPHVDAGRLRGRSDARHGLHGRGDEDSRARPHVPRARWSRSRRSATCGRSRSRCWP